MSKHFTPGPWEIHISDTGGEWTGWPLSITAKHVHIDKCVVRPGGFYPYKWDASTSQVEAVANARLIAAAPDMRDALEECAVFLSRLNGKVSLEVWRSIYEPLTQARAALAKAAGAQP